MGLTCWKKIKTKKKNLLKKKLKSSFIQSGFYTFRVFKVFLNFLKAYFFVFNLREISLLAYYNMGFKESRLVYKRKWDLYRKNMIFGRKMRLYSTKQIINKKKKLHTLPARRGWRRRYVALQSQVQWITNFFLQKKHSKKKN